MTSRWRAAAGSAAWATLGAAAAGASAGFDEDVSRRGKKGPRRPSPFTPPRAPPRPSTAAVKAAAAAALQAAEEYAAQCRLRRQRDRLRMRQQFLRETRAMEAATARAADGVRMRRALGAGLRVRTSRAVEDPLKPAERRRLEALLATPRAIASPMSSLT